MASTSMSVSQTTPRSFAARQIAQRSRPAAVRVAAAKLIAKSDIPAFIPRSDLMSQVWRWAEIEVVANGTSNYGVACTVEFITREECPWGFIVNMQEDGKTVTTLKMAFDDERVSKHAFIGRHENGMPKAEGAVTEVEGAHFEMWKVDDHPVSEDLRQSIRGICTGVSEALTRYYSFGSVFSEDF